MRYDREKLFVATVLLVIGGYFFMAGLEEEQDYLRLNHAGWHIFGSGFGYFCIQSVTVTPQKSPFYSQLSSK